MSWVLLCLLLIAAPQERAASGDARPIVEEVLAVVDRSPILTSDIDLAALVRLVDRKAGEGTAAYRARLLDLRLRLEIQYRDLETSGTLFRLEPDLEASLIGLSQRAGGKEQLHEGLTRSGLTWDDLEHLALRLAVVTTFVEQRLRPRISISLEELQHEYRRLADELTGAGAPVPDFDVLRDRLTQLLSERKLNAEIEAWLEQSRARLEVTRFAP
jgi:hypothetical protein